MKRRQRNLIRQAIGKTMDGFGAHVRLPSVTGGGKSQSQVGSEPVLRVELTSDLHPGDYASARIRNANKWSNAKLTGTPKKVLDDRAASEELVPGSALEIQDIDGICFALRGEWIEVKWRNDLGYFVPTGPFGLTRLARAVGAVSANSMGTFEVLKRTADALSVATTVQARTDFGEAAINGVDNDEEVQITYIADREVTAVATLSSGTGAWHVIKGAASEARPAKLLKIDGLRPMYEVEASGVYTYITPAITDAPSYSRDSGTGELTLGSDENTVVNPAQRIWDGNSPRGRLALGVPIAGGAYVPVPLATDPFVPAVSIEYSEGPVLDVDDSIWIMSDEFTLRTFGKAVAADADDWYPLFARPTSRGLFLLKPGKYLYQARCNWTFYVSGTVGDPDQFDSGPASAGTAHTHEIDRDPRGIVSFGFRVFDIDASAPGAATPSNGAGRFACCDFSQGYWWSHQCQPVLTLCGMIDVPASGKPKRINLCASFHAYHYDSGVANLPQIKLEGAEIQVIPVSGYLQDDGLSTADQHMDMYNPWASGSYVWHEPYSNPPDWDKAGA